VGRGVLGPSTCAPLREKAIAAKGQEQADALRQLDEALTLKPQEVRRCVATFGPLDAAADAVRIYVRNLTDTIGVREVEGKRILEEHVLLVTYKIPGDEFGKSEDEFRFVDRKWIKVEREVPAAQTSNVEKK